MCLSIMKFFFIILFNATIMFSNKLINNNVGTVAFYFILPHEHLKKKKC